MLIYASAVSSSAVCEVFLGVKWLEVNMVDYYVLAQLPISLNAGSIPATSTKSRCRAVASSQGS